jgi:hypothetical protein
MMDHEPTESFSRFTGNAPRCGLWYHRMSSGERFTVATDSQANPAAWA